MIDAGPTLGRRVHYERLLAGKTQAELGRVLGIAADSVAAFESGRRTVSPRELVGAATLCGVPLAFFCAGDDQPVSAVIDEPHDRPRWLAMPRPLTILSGPGFAAVDAVVQLWRETRGALTDEVYEALAAGDVLHRTYLVRPSADRSRLITEYCAPGVAFLLPCESLALVGHDFHEMPDRDYGARMAEAYLATAFAGALRVEAVRAEMRTSAGATVLGRYDRVLMPWRRCGDLFVMGISLRRELTIIP